jgi:hypothetical protein
VLNGSTAPGVTGVPTPAGFGATVTPPTGTAAGQFVFQDPPVKGGVTYAYTTMNCGNPGAGGPWATIDARVIVQ